MLLDFAIESCHPPHGWGRSQAGGVAGLGLTTDIEPPSNRVCSGRHVCHSVPRAHEACLDPMHVNTVAAESGDMREPAVGVEGGHRVTIGT